MAVPPTAPLPEAPDRTLKQRLQPTPVMIVLVLHVLIGLGTLAAVALHAMGDFESEVDKADQALSMAAREQVIAIGDLLQNAQFVLGQLSNRLNEARALGSGMEPHDLLRQFHGLAEGSEDLMLVRQDGTVVAASQMRPEPQALEGLCPVLAQQRTRIESLGLWSMPAEAGGNRCPAPETVVIVFQHPALQSIHQGSLWLLVHPDRLRRQLFESLPGTVPLAHYRLVLSDYTVLLQGALDQQAGLPPEFPSFLSTAPAAQRIVPAQWVDLRSGERLSGVSDRVAGTPLHVQVVYPIWATVLPHLRGHANLWLGGGLVFLVLWSSLAVLLVRTLQRYQRALVREQTRFARSLAFVQVGVWEWDCPRERLFWSEQVPPLLGVTASNGASEGTPQDFVAGLPDAERERVLKTLVHCRDHGGYVDLECQVDRGTGRMGWVHLFGSTERDPAGQALRMFGIAQDVTDRKESSMRLDEAAQHNQAILDHVAEGIFTMDADGTLASFNRAATRIFGWSAEEIIGRNMQELMPGALRGLQAGSEAMRTVRARAGREESALHKDGHEFPVHLSITRTEQRGAPLYIGLVRDITEQRSAAAEIEHLAFYDPLTGLPNRRLITERIDRALRAGERSGQRAAVLMLDLDRFKLLNDTRGHAAGDRLLVQVGERLRRVARPGDTVARIGGDEFVLLIEQLGPDAAVASTQCEQIAQQVLGLFEAPFRPDGQEYSVSASLGIVPFEAGQPASAATLLAQAEMAMYEAKASGRRQHRFFDTALQASITERAALIGDLRMAVAQQQLALHYQPQFDDSGRLLGFEALLRWRHPERGPISPALFIPLAEESGLILELGQWVLQRGCQQLAAWHAQPALAHLTLAVNVSAQQFRSPGFEQQVLDALSWSGADPGHLKLELTESMLVHDVESLIDKMARLKRHGVQFSLDDFGTGYSSLAYLKRLPLDQLKIDQGFVRDLLTDTNDASIVTAIITLGQSLGLPVIAEGVETEAQRDALRQRGCRAYQGYLFSPPLDAPQLVAFLQRYGGVATPPSMPLQ
ncbi:EAL domain-containing protein [Acidovorax lacteus]|uniref:EAL domain-containing protein n=1 Tax=Acidovorax lacteus TaxID=1924988 RepID=A0ABP8LKU2_9BURK